MSISKEWLNNEWFTHTMEYWTASKKKVKKKSTSEKVQEAKKSFPNIPLFIWKGD